MMKDLQDATLANQFMRFLRIKNPQVATLADARERLLTAEEDTAQHTAVLVDQKPNPNPIDKMCLDVWTVIFELLPATDMLNLRLISTKLAEAWKYVEPPIKFRVIQGRLSQLLPRGVSLRMSELMITMIDKNREELSFRLRASEAPGRPKPLEEFKLISIEQSRNSQLPAAIVNHTDKKEKYLIELRYYPNSRIKDILRLMLAASLLLITISGFVLFGVLTNLGPLIFSISANDDLCKPGSSYDAPNTTGKISCDDLYQLNGDDFWPKVSVTACGYPNTLLGPWSIKAMQDACYSLSKKCRPFFSSNNLDPTSVHPKQFAGLLAGLTAYCKNYSSMLIGIFYLWAAVFHLIEICFLAQCLLRVLQGKPKDPGDVAVLADNEHALFATVNDSKKIQNLLATPISGEHKNLVPHSAPVMPRA